MKFEKSKVYTGINADDLPLYSKVITADSLKELLKKVEKYKSGDTCDIIKHIRSNEWASRFEISLSDFYVPLRLSCLKTRRISSFYCRGQSSIVGQICLFER